MNRIFSSLAAAALGLTALGVPTSTAQATAPAAPGCSTDWGSRAKVDQRMSRTTVAGVRAGRHTCFDRMVIDQSGPTTGYAVKYVNHVRRDGSGTIVAVAGDAKLQVVTRAGATSRSSVPDVGGYRTFRQIRWGGSFEGHTTYALGVRARLPFRVFTVRNSETGTSRLVVDVAHSW